MPKAGCGQPSFGAIVVEGAFPLFFCPSEEPAVSDDGPAGARRTP
jgi:hypothetical protein